MADDEYHIKPIHFLTFSSLGLLRCLAYELFKRISRILLPATKITIGIPTNTKVATRNSLRLPRSNATVLEK